MTPNLKQLPKLELHAHLNGSLSVGTLRALAKLENNVADESEWPNFNSNLSNLSLCFGLFRIAHNLTQTKEAITLATLLTIEEFAADGVIYLELRSTPRELKNGGKDVYLEAMVRGVMEAKTVAPNIVVTLLVSINRSENIDMAKENAELALKFRKKYPNIVVGVDFSGDPSKGKFVDFVTILNEIKSKNMGVTLHFGEIPNDDEVREIIMFGPHRLGHGTCLSEDNFQLLRDRCIPIELCISSNVKCGTVAKVENHHYKKLKTIQMPIILCTDDKGVFNTTLSNEYEIAQQHLNLNISEAWSMNLKALEFIFLKSPEVTQQIKEHLLNWKQENSHLFQ